jgi:hypothetical protein
MPEFAQIKAEVPRALKRQFYVALTCREETFVHWLRSQIETWLHETDLQSDISDLDRKATKENKHKPAGGAAEIPCENIG